MNSGLPLVYICFAEPSHMPLLRTGLLAHLGGHGWWQKPPPSAIGASTSHPWSPESGFKREGPKEKAQNLFLLLSHPSSDAPIDRGPHSGVSFPKTDLGAKYLSATLQVRRQPLPTEQGSYPLTEPRAASLELKDLT